LGVLAEVLPEGVPTTVAGLPLVGRLGVEIQLTAVVRGRLCAFRVDPLRPCR